MTVLVSAATRVGATLETWAKLKDHRSVKMARCEINYFGVARQLTADAFGGEPDANTIDGAYRQWLTWADRPSLKVAAAKAARKAYRASDGDLLRALHEWRRLMRPPSGGASLQVTQRPAKRDASGELYA
jgi:hypothetical protein